MNDTEALPILPHISSEFYAWLWWSSEIREGEFDLGEPLGCVDLWVDERLVFRHPNETRVSAVLTGENPSTTLEARAALAGGKVLQEIRIGMRRDSREFHVTLKGPAMDFAQARLPQVVNSRDEEGLYDRMFLYEELGLLVASLFKVFSDERLSTDWQSGTLRAIREWLMGELD